MKESSKGKFRDSLGDLLNDLYKNDFKESIAALGVLPAMSFTPDSKDLVVSYGGKIYSINIVSKKAREIPFTATIDISLM